MSRILVVEYFGNGFISVREVIYCGWNCKRQCFGNARKQFYLIRKKSC